MSRENEIRNKRWSANQWRAERDRSPLPDLSNCKFADHLRPMVLLSINTGIRQGELFHLAWRGLLEDAQIVDFRWHDLRHHFASKLVVAGVPINTVRELLGHSDIKMTFRYAHLAPGQMREAVEAISK